jgi:murein DD-endopeptidase MepM/ murein hydrolase activator NlpD
MAVTFSKTRLGVVLGVLLALAVPAGSFYLGYLIGHQGSSDASMMASAPARPVSDQAAATPDQVDDAIDEIAGTLETTPPAPVVQQIAVESGDNLMGILVRAGVDRGEAHAAIASLKGVYDPRRDLNVGDMLQITFGPAGPNRPGIGGPDGTASDYTFDGLRLPVSFNRDVAVTRGADGGYSASEIERPLRKIPVHAAGVINSNLFVDGREAGVPVDVLVELIRIYSFDVDFQREIQPGDRFEVMFDQFADDNGKPVHNGDVAFARLTLSGTELPLYRYRTTAGNLDYFNAKGASVRKALMRTPIDGARLSSRYGMRKHPILGYSRLHAGVDFAAPYGTPIYAAGSGTIETIGLNGGYGKYIRIRHNGTYSTAYAHMKGYARGMTRGKRVNQGQVIGYVGSTGQSTGPHLHYEVHRDGRQINPQALKLPSGETLKGKELALFDAHRTTIDGVVASLTPVASVAAQDDGCTGQPVETIAASAKAAEPSAPTRPC